MSTNTIKQRIALVAVSALTAGVLSLVAAPAASSAELVVGTGEANNPFAADTLNVANKTHATTATASATIASNVSTGLRLYDDGIGSTATQQAWMNASGALTLITGAATADELMITASGKSVDFPPVVLSSNTLAIKGKPLTP